MMKIRLSITFVLALAASSVPVYATTHLDALKTLTMRDHRAAHTATLLDDGRVLITGGFRTESEPLASAELFDPKTNAFKPADEMTTPRVGHAAIALQDGRVLILGGWGKGNRVASAEVYDPARGTFAAINPMRAPRADFTATLLRDGRVLIVGGFSARNAPNLAVEVFDPRTNAFLQVGTLGQARSAHTATLLRDGTVLLIGGTTLKDAVLQTTEMFDPATNAIAPAGDLNAPRRKHAAALLPDGRVLIIGGSDQRDWRGRYATTELYDPKSRTFAAGPTLNAERFKLSDAVALLHDGKLIVGGGNRVIERFDPVRTSFTRAGQLPTGYFYATATPLNDGRVLIAGGYDDSIAATDGAWVYR